MTALSWPSTQIKYGDHSAYVKFIHTEAIGTLTHTAGHQSMNSSYNFFLTKNPCFQGLSFFFKPTNFELTINRRNRRWTMKYAEYYFNR